MSGGGDKQETETEPWEGLQPFLMRGFRGARQWLDQAPGGFSPETEAALNMMTGRAMSGSPLLGMAQGSAAGMLGAPGTEALTRTAMGEYTGRENPYMDQMTESIRRRVLPSVQSSFGMAGRTGGSPMAQAAMAREMTSALAPHQFADYGRERQLQEAAAGRLAQNQLSAMGMAPGLAAADYGDMQRLLEVGGMREGEGFDRLARYMSLLGQGAPFLGGTGTTTGRQSTNPLMMLLGLGAMGAGAAF